MALAHPVTEELHAAGVITAHGTVDEPIIEWLTVLSRRDFALLVYAQSHSSPMQPERVLLARFSRWWVALECYGAIVRLSGVGTSTTERSAGDLINAEIKRLCGDPPPAGVRPITLDAVELLAEVRDKQSLHLFLRTQKLDPDQCGVLIQASDPERSTQISIVASPGDAGAVTIIDSPQGRLVAEHIRIDTRTWMVISPGSARHISSTIQRMLRQLPVSECRSSHRRVV